MKRLFVILTLFMLLLLAFSSISYGWRDGRGPQVQGGPGVEVDPWAVKVEVDPESVHSDGSVQLSTDWDAGQSITTDLYNAGKSGHNVLAYGAVGDGVADDTAAVAAAITAASSGGTIIFPQGTYNITTVDVDVEGLIVRGVGRGSSIIEVQTASDRKGFNVSVDKVVFQDMTIQSSSDVTDGNDLVGIYYEDTALSGSIGYGTISNVECIGFSLAGVYVVNSIYFNVRDYRSEDCLNGIYMINKDGSVGTTFFLENLYLTGGRDIRTHTITADASTDYISGVAAGDVTPVVFYTTGTLPAPLATDTTYFVKNPAGSTFQVCATPEAVSVIDITDAGSGIHTINVLDGSGIHLEHTVRGTISNAIFEYCDFGVHAHVASFAAYGMYYEAIESLGYDNILYDSKILDLGEIRADNGDVTYWRGTAAADRYNSAYTWLDSSARDVTAQRTLTAVDATVTGTATIEDIVSDTITARVVTPKTITPLVDGSLAACASFNGSSEYMTGGNVLDAGTDDVSMSFWINTPDTTGYYQGIGKNIYAASTKGYAIDIGSGYPRYFYNDGTLSIDDSRHAVTTAVNDGYWHHVAATWDRDGNLTGYIDGESVGTWAINNTDIDNAYNFLIAYNTDGIDNYYLEADIQDVRIYIASGDYWSAEEIAAQYDSRMDTSSGESLTSSWLMDDAAASTTIDDAQVAGNDLSLAGGDTTNFGTHTKLNGSGLVFVDSSGALVTTTGAMSTPYEDVYYVAKSGGDYTSIQTALDAHTDGGEVFLVAPGSYTDTINFTASNQTVRGIGTTARATVTQVDAAVVNFGAYTGCSIADMKITMSAPTTALDMITGSGTLSLRDCHQTVTSAAALAQLQQPSCIYTTGTVKVVRGTMTYNNSGVCAGGIKAPVRLGASGAVELRRVTIDVDGSNAAQGTTVAYEAAGVTAECTKYRCTVNIDDTTATVVAGFGYLVGTGTSHEVLGNNVHITVGAGNAGYGYYIDGTTTVRSMYNHIEVTDAGGNSYSYRVDTGCTLISQFDDIVAADGESTVAGTVTKVNSESDGNFEVTGEVISSNEDWIPVADFSPTGDGSSNSVSCNRYADGTNRRMYNRTLGGSDTQDMDWYAEKAVVKTPTSLTLYTRASDYANCAMTIQVWDYAGNADATGAVTITPSANDTWQEKTYTFTSTYTNDEELWIKIAITSLDTADTIDFGRIKVIY